MRLCPGRQMPLFMGEFSRRPERLFVAMEMTIMTAVEQAKVLNACLGMK